MQVAQALPTYLTDRLRGQAVSAMPACIERVARESGAVYSANWREARLNLHADEQRVRRYLGTYLPRTVFEFMTIGSEMLGHTPMRKTLPTNRPLRVLDLGSGTGGAWMGLATSLIANGFRQGLQIDAVDGNRIALAKQSAFAKSLSADSGITIALHTACRQLGPDVNAFEVDLQSVLSGLDCQYDFILVSKHLSELYCSAGPAAHGVVYQTLNLLADALRPTGYLVVLDMTTHINEVGEFFPQLMARELGLYLSQQPHGLRPVLPVPCAVNAKAGCAGSKGHCYTQRHLRFSHSVNADSTLRAESTKITYFVLAHRAQAMGISAGYSPHLAYHVNDQHHDQSCHAGRIVQARGFNGFLTPVARAC